MMKDSYKKESPLPTLVSLGGGSSGSLYPSLGESYFIGVFGTSSSDGSDYGIDIAIDSSENIYICGPSYGLYSTTGVGGTPLIFKYNKDGEYQWQRTFSMFNSGVAPEDIICDSSGNVYIGAVVSGNGALVKYNGSGDLQWTRSFGTTSNEHVRGIGIDSSDNVYTIGYGHKRNSNNSSWSDQHVVKYNSSGTQQFVRCIGDYYTGKQGWCIDVDSSGNYYPCGYVNDGVLGILVGKFTSSHTRSWQKRIWSSGNSTNSQGGIAVDSSGNVHIVGDTNASATGSRDICIIKLDSSGNTIWQRYLGIANRTLNGRDITIDNSGNVYIIGKGSVDYSGDPIYPYTGTMDTIIIAKYSSSGVLQWKRFLGVMISPVQSGNYTDVEEGRSIKVDPTGKNLYIAGITRNGNFGYGQDDVVWAKLPTDGSGIGTYSGPGPRDIIYGDATNLTSKAGSLSNNTYNTDHQSMTATGYPYTEYSHANQSFTPTVSNTTVEIVT